MSMRSFLMLLFVTLLAFGGAVIVVAVQTRPSIVVGERAAVFPQLVKQINAVGRIEVVTKKHRFVIAGAGDSWGIEEKNNYKVPRDRVRNFILELANLKLVERKTKVPERYGRLELEDPNVGKSRSRHVRVLTSDGKVLASGIIGRRKYFLYVDGRGGTYVRRENEEQAWLAEGEVNFDGAPAYWLDRAVFELEPSNVRVYAIIHPDGTILKATRDKPGGKFSIPSKPENKIYKTQNEAERLAWVVEKFEFADVEPAPYKNFDNPDRQKHHATYEFFNGLVLAFEVITLSKPEGASKFDEPPRWARVRASVGPIVTDGRQKTIQNMANELNKKLVNWEFLLEELDGLRTTKKLDDMLKSVDG